MIKVALVGIGFMGRVHLENYIRLEKEGFPVKLAAICDVDEEKFKCSTIEGNIKSVIGGYDLSKYNLYTDFNEMLEKEELDMVDMPLPTYLHDEYTIRALNRGLNVLCEKPMALTPERCQGMIDAAQSSGKKLMIGQCLRFWPAYEYLKECVEDKRFGSPVGGCFFRGGGTPKWSWDNWLLDVKRSGGCIMDQHVHDIDTVNWLFGKPEYVSTIGKNSIPGSGYDILSTNYVYPDGKIINTQDDWTLNGEYGFEMRYRMNFEGGNLVFEKGILTVNPNNAPSFKPELSPDDGYYRELKYYLNSVIIDSPIEAAAPQSTKETIEIAVSEIESANNKGAFVAVK
jgi:predicted dehydrogenase